MKTISLYTKNNSIIHTLKSERSFKLKLNSPFPWGEVCIVDCDAIPDSPECIFHPCIAIVSQSAQSVPLDFDYVIQAPFDVSCMVRAIRLLCTNEADEYIFSRVSDIFEEIGMDTKRLGFSYAAYGVALYLKYGGQCKFCDIFEEIAQNNNTTAYAVERAIRTAIEKAWQYGDIQKMYALFGNSINPEKGKPSNAEFIAGIAMQLSDAIN